MGFACVRKCCLAAHPWRVIDSFCEAQSEALLLPRILLYRPLGWTMHSGGWGSRPLGWTMHSGGWGRRPWWWRWRTSWQKSRGQGWPRRGKEQVTNPLSLVQKVTKASVISCLSTDFLANLLDLILTVCRHSMPHLPQAVGTRDPANSRK